MKARSAIARILLLAVLWYATGGCAAPDCRSWQALRETAEGTLFHRCRPDSPLDEVMIETRFRAAPGRLFALVNDYDAFVGLIPDVAESRVLAVEGASRWVYHRLHLPGPVADRVYVMRSTQRVDGVPADAWRVEWTLSDRPFPEVDLAAGVRPDSLSGFWEITAGDDPDSTKARYAVHVDPGGRLPAWLVRRLTDGYVQRVVAAIRGRLEAQ